MQSPWSKVGLVKARTGRGGVQEKKDRKMWTAEQISKMRDEDASLDYDSETIATKIVAFAEDFEKKYAHDDTARATQMRNIFDAIDDFAATVVNEVLAEQEQAEAPELGVCPECGSDEVTGGALDAGETFVSSHDSCNACGCKWETFYVFDESHVTSHSRAWDGKRAVLAQDRRDRQCG